MEPESAQSQTPPSDGPTPPSGAVPQRKGSPLRRQLERTQQKTRSNRRKLPRILGVGLVLTLALAGGAYGLRIPVYRALAAGEGELATWAVEGLVELRDPGSFGIYVRELGRSDERETFAVLVYELAGRRELPDALDEPLAELNPGAQDEHRALVLEGLARSELGWQRGAVYALLTLREEAWLVDTEALVSASRLLAQPDTVTRRWVAMLLAWGPAPEATHAALVRSALSGEPDALVRRYAVQALGHTRAQEHAPVLLRALEDEEAEVRREATLAMTYLGGPVDLDALTRLLDDAPAGQRPQVLEAIANDPGPRATEILVRTLEHTEAHVDTQLAAVRLLALRPGPEILAPLARALGNRDPSVRVVAARGLAKHERGREAARDLVEAFARRVEGGSSDTLAAWNELLVLTETLRTLTGFEPPTLSESRDSWQTALVAWRGQLATLGGQ